MKKGVATFTLDHGRCPPWLFNRMVNLGREMTRVLIEEYGPDEFVERISDPVWFQSLGTVLAFDWNASGLTTILTAALKEAIRGQERQFGIFICGGKGGTSRKTPDQIQFWGERISLPEKSTEQLITNSKMSAKVDSALVQDGYTLYHHAFFFSKNGAWAVVQQGMNTNAKSARRYHWFDRLTTDNGQLTTDNETIDFVNEPHKAISAQTRHANVLNLVAGKSSKTRETSVDLIREGYKRVKSDLELLRKHSNEMSKVVAFSQDGEEYIAMELSRNDFFHHPVELENFANSKYLDRILQKLSDRKPEDYKSLVSFQGVGPKTVRALSLVSEIIYGAMPSYIDPARYSFAHGGKDAIPYPVDRETYDKTIEIMRKAVNRSRIPFTDKQKALRRLAA
ncbi:MAG: hypothetical protein A3C30_01635 [Candidatus Levybacteria bacterium RIFCSPHIGHO2_02_FULL_40_18]|nr:MAG: hypothetical protein A2869_01200 [Candidatus Levybacteria bacterium RIFCSPHIGHO2_01_FULL_40_58]OGH26694.1 MAG: hypothetical protein A3C30_01635 [Candidatus Levybacteria bacterium RIFCSPHIGHO2_02_FULL_40_18]OGH31629.1 MAG: hypothetical protein A3E43_01355 [Candidatus Levybacteria bacterium RIFCSPHIGHO2_12_FULL_40_31]OGH40257.1 MAG: hypothetical protein A2894_02370 [Candidatus Levybacteria bacterium RIFCSPLOWO2_01_FULL_40_64]OGH48705.1 MAG: hypothetical protein A3I54_03530 [Candidatus Lev